MVATMVAVGALVAGAHAEPIDEPAVASAVAVRGTLPGPFVGGCRVFPTDNAWNVNIRNAPLHPRSAQMIGFIQAHGSDNLHPDFGENPAYGIPYVVVPQSQATVPITYDAYGDESDPGPFPIPLNAPVEGGSDRHVLVVQQGTCHLFELFVARRSGAGWVANSGARFDLKSNALRPLGWTSADAAGLPIFPGLVRYEEVAAGRIDHAIRVTFSTTRRGYILPATHFASSNTDIDAPAMGQRLRLKAGYDISSLTGQARVIAEAMKNYGVIVADNGSNWYFQGAPNPGWNDDDLNQLKGIPGTAFEAVDMGPVRTG
ncbi:MAG: hypothetical protein Q8M22_00145 [Actinomycetota bacterium]|nr:hypothetical protein [Actinomycetota bacterium]